jgi:hypothetical protein
MGWKRDGLSEEVTFNTLLGKVIKDVTLQHAVHDDGDEIIFDCEDGTSYCMLHCQDCCECVTVEDFDLEEARKVLIGQQIVRAEESTSTENERKKPRTDDSFTWTFYKLATVKGWVDIRWYGTSNGYYSEGVELWEMEKVITEDVFWTLMENEYGKNYCKICKYGGTCIPYSLVASCMEKEDSLCYRLKHSED